MNRQKSLQFILFVSLVFFAFTDCTKNGGLGPTGPAGPQGPQGNANVQSITFLNQSFTAGIVLSFSIPAITQNIVDSGEVVYYTRPAGGTDWIPLPMDLASYNQVITPWTFYVGGASVVANFNSSAANASNYDFR